MTDVAKPFWPDRDRRAWIFSGDVRMAPEEFTQYKERDPRGIGAPYTLYKLRINRDGRNAWHLVSRQISYGQSNYFAQKIIITLGEAS